MKILILGQGRIGQALRFFFKRTCAKVSVLFLEKDAQAKDADILIGALPGEFGRKSLELALLYRKNLIDLTDLDPDEFYLKKKSQIEKEGIIVIPGCGFSPGLTNLILGKELFANRDIHKIEVKAGSLSPKLFYFPFLWCFEDLIWEHNHGSFQKIGGEKVGYPAFGAKRNEKFYNIDAETYFTASGFEQIFSKKQIKDLSFRVIRPKGFYYFYQYMNNYGLLSRKNIKLTQEIVQQTIEDNITLSQIILASRNRRICWDIKSASRKKDALNSMQKITALFAVSIARLILSGNIKNKGLVFCEDLADQKETFNQAINFMKENRILIKRTVRGI
ncbi:MAG: hypothetical protein MUF05_04060 [Candidatus Omnitrophica bacterium]|jgi:saccharopine dehydrogenase-like NADP-dependent oxidoreductase|nr:hypothetical protein [Candidatus Omnitrophota bacterium]